MHVQQQEGGQVGAEQKTRLREVNHRFGNAGDTIPSTMASAAPNAAAEETPECAGLASGLVRIVCIPGVGQAPEQGPPPPLHQRVRTAYEYPGINDRVPAASRCQGSARSFAAPG